MFGMANYNFPRTMTMPIEGDLYRCTLNVNTRILSRALVYLLV